MNILIYIVAGAIGLYLSFVGIVFAALGGALFVFIIGGLLLAAHIWSIRYVRRKAIQGKGRVAAIMLVAPMFIVWGVAWIFAVAKKDVVAFFERESPEFTAECLSAGVQFFKPPTSLVRSIAYDWDQKYPPAMNYFKAESGTKINSLSYINRPYPSSIEFTETRLSGREGLRPGELGPYVRFPKGGNFYGVPALTADVVVEYRMTPVEELKKALMDQRMVRYELTITDRRNGEKLSYFRYVLDVKNKRGCGLTGYSEMDERAFVFKTIGVR